MAPWISSASRDLNHPHDVNPDHDADPPRDAEPADVRQHDVDQHRADVVRRLLARGVGPRTLTLLLPDWEQQVRDQIDELVGPSTR